jgi:hypothetical protein
MADVEALRLLGSPDVRNAILLNEIGILVHDVGKLSAEFVERGGAFPHHLVLRRLTRGRDPFLASDASPRSAVCYALRNCFPVGDESSVAHLLVDALSAEGGVWGALESHGLEQALSRVYRVLRPDRRGAFERVAQVARAVRSDMAWQVEREGEVAAMEPPFIAADGFHHGLDQLPFVGDLVEMQGRTWHPEAMLSPEVRLFRALHDRHQVEGARRSSCDLERLAGVRELYCEVVANQFLEINNIRKDGPGDLGSWFWKSRLCSQSQGATALLHAFDQGVGLQGEDREAVRWLGVRPATQWAFGKVLLGNRGDGGPTSLWEHCRMLSGLHKSSAAQALIEGSWPQGNRLSWCTLTIGLEDPDPGAMDMLRDLVEIEYPLGNELVRSDTEVSFTFPDLSSELRAPLVDGLQEAVGQLVGTGAQPRLTVDRCPSHRVCREVGGRDSA